MLFSAALIIAKTGREALLVAPKSNVIHLPTAMVKAIGTVGDLVGNTQYSIVSEYPAHLPAIEADEGPLIQVIASLVVFLVRTTQRKEIRVRAELFPSGESLPPFLPYTEKQYDILRQSPWTVVSIADVEPSVPLTEIDTSPLGAVMEDLAVEEVLSLEACAEIISRFGGHLWIESEESLGTRLQIALPLRATKVDSADLSSLRRILETHLPEDDPVSRTLLVMVEDPEMRELLIQELVDAGYRAIPVTSGGDILPMALEADPDLILLDLLSRDPAALDIALILKHHRQTQHIPVLFVTAVSDEEGVIQMGAANFLVRHAGTGALLATVRSVLHAGLHPTTRVLVVEPDEVLRENIVLMIQANGYRVTVATGPEEALVLAERVEPGLILVNAQLAQERDYWLLRRLRQNSFESEIFVLASALSDEDGRAAISRGASGYGETGDLSDLLDQVLKRFSS